MDNKKIFLSSFENLKKFKKEVDIRNDILSKLYSNSYVIDTLGLDEASNIFKNVCYLISSDFMKENAMDLAEYFIYELDLGEGNIAKCKGNYALSDEQNNKSFDISNEESLYDALIFEGDFSEQKLSENN